MDILMGSFFKKIFNKKKEEIIEDEPQSHTSKINLKAPGYENQLICNACGEQITNVPRFFNLNGRQMVFHKKCLKKLKKGNMNF